MKTKHKAITSLTLLIILTGLLTGCINHEHTPTNNITIKVETPGIVETGNIYYINITLDTNNTEIAGIQISFTYNTHQSTFMMLLPGTLFPKENRYIQYGETKPGTGTVTGIALATLNITIQGHGSLIHLVFIANTKHKPNIELFNIIVGNHKTEELEYKIIYE